MKVLIVEDNLAMIEALSEHLGKLLGAVQVAFARSRASAIVQLDSAFDVVVLDLKIPTEDGRLDEEVEHGLYVFEEIQRKLPGTPIFVFTAFGTEEIYRDRILPKAHVLDVWGSGETLPIISGISKNNLPDLLRRILQIKAIVDATDEIEVNSRKHLQPQERRVLCIFGRKHHASLVDVVSLSGGLSGVNVLRVQVRDQQGVNRLIAVGKIGPHAETAKEFAAYSSEVIRLPNGAYSVYIDQVTNGAGYASGIFYRLLEGYDRDFLDLLRNGATREATEVVRILREFEHPWVDGVPAGQSTIGDLRRRLLADENLKLVSDHLDGSGSEAFEERPVLVRWCSQHGDMHPGNILVGPDNRPTLIDFGRVGRAPACLDPVTLELSLLFHPNAVEFSKTWPTVDGLRTWADPQVYLSDCPYADVIRELRDWDSSVHAGLRELYATVYAYAVRQLKFENTNKVFARTLIEVAIQAVQERT